MAAIVYSFLAYGRGLDVSKPQVSSTTTSLIKEFSFIHSFIHSFSEDLPQACPLHNRRQFWAVKTPVTRRLLGSLDDLQCPAAFEQRTRVSTRVSDKKKTSSTPASERDYASCLHLPTRQGRAIKRDRVKVAPKEVIVLKNLWLHDE